MDLVDWSERRAATPVGPLKTLDWA